MIEHLDTPARRARYAKGDFPAADRVKDLNKRYRWDLLWAADRAKTSLWTARVYDYANDAHIDTALRALVAPLAQANPRRRRKSRRK
jgi:hypothetical protein